MRPVWRRKGTHRVGSSSATEGQGGSWGTLNPGQAPQWHPEQLSQMLAKGTPAALGDPFGDKWLSSPPSPPLERCQLPGCSSHQSNAEQADFSPQSLLASACSYNLTAESSAGNDIPVSGAGRNQHQDYLWSLWSETSPSESVPPLVSLLSCLHQTQHPRPVCYCLANVTGRELSLHRVSLGSFSQQGTF